jgi:hypothetical protein
MARARDSRGRFVSGGGFDVVVTGDEAYQRKLAQLELFLEDLRPMWPLFVPMFIGWMGAQFSSEGGWGGQAWAPLSPAYAAWKSQHYPGKSILIREGDLRQAASQPRREATPRTLTLWIDDPKAGYHQEGTDDMPARPLFPSPLPAAARRDVDTAAREYVSTLVRRLGL